VKGKVRCRKAVENQGRGNRGGRISVVGLNELGKKHRTAADSTRCWIVAPADSTTVSSPSVAARSTSSGSTLLASCVILAHSLAVKSLAVVFNLGDSEPTIGYPREIQFANLLNILIGHFIQLHSRKQSEERLGFLH
jgi:hypothetical protein